MPAPPSPGRTPETKNFPHFPYNILPLYTPLMRFNPLAHLDTSRIEDLRPGSTTYRPALSNRLRKPAGPADVARVRRKRRPKR